MTKNPITVPPDHTVEETARVLLQNRISGVPVVDDHSRIVGIITQDDLFKVLTSITGVDKKGIQFAFIIEDRPKSVIKITDLIRSFNGRVVTLFTTHEGTPPGSRHVYLRAYQIDRQKLPQLLKELKEKATLLYMVDHRQNTREVYEM